MSDEKLSQQYLAELKIQAITQMNFLGLKESQIRGILDRIENPEFSEKNSWPEIWGNEGRAALAAGDYGQAARLFNLGRFPCAYDSGRKYCYDECIAAFKTELEKSKVASSLNVKVRGKDWQVYLGRHPDAAAPLAVCMGGTFAIKENGRFYLDLVEQLGCSVLLVDFPGIGGNPFPYGPESHRTYGELFDALALLGVNTQQVIPAGMGFGGHVMLRLAAEDSRIKALATAAAPVREFFTSPEVWSRTPHIMKVTLSYLMQVPTDRLPGKIKDLALTPEMLRRIQIPVCYLGAQRDNLIPESEMALLRQDLPHLELHSYDDTHGVPNHFAEVKEIYTKFMAKQSRILRQARIPQAA